MLLPEINLKMKRINTPKSKGSVGRYMPIPPNFISSKLIDNGVKKTMAKNMKSSAYMLIQSMSNAIGSKAM